FLIILAALGLIQSPILGGGHLFRVAIIPHPADNAANKDKHHAQRDEHGRAWAFLGILQRVNHPAQSIGEHVGVQILAMLRFHAATAPLLTSWILLMIGGS